MSNVEKLRNRLQEMLDGGMKNFHITPGPDYYKLSADEKAQAILDALDAPGELMTNIDGDMRISSPPPMTGLPQMTVDEWLKYKNVEEAIRENPDKIRKP